ncbi:MAG: dTDP-4-dehydrorhamnose 3,5-epimerase [Nitrospiraceae bacterium]
MIFTETALKDVFLIDPEPVRDERGMFARTWCQREFEAHGISARWVQSSVSVNRQKGTMRGLHYKSNAEVRLVRCTAGAIYDVIVDLRPASPTYCQYVGITLSADNHRAVYVPEYCAHGFLTLEQDSHVLYYMSEFYVPANDRGFRWNDPVFKIAWPEPILVMSEKDRTWPAFFRDGAPPL